MLRNEVDLRMELESDVPVLDDVAASSLVARSRSPNSGRESDVSVAGQCALRRRGSWRWSGRFR
jgi:hypothetical protein